MIKATVHVFCDLGGVRRLGKIMKVNKKTVWLKIMKGASTFFVVKRHEVKHNVKVKFTYEEVPE